MTRRLFVLALLLLFIAPTSAVADTSYRVIVHPDNPVTTISKGQLSRMLLKTQSSWGSGNRIMPVDLRATSRVRDAISHAVHGRSALVIKNWWNQQIFAGKGVPPPELATDAKVIAYVLANPGAVGYVSGDVNLGDVKVVALTE